MVRVASWVLVVGGFLWAYEGITSTDLIQTMFGNLEPVIDVVVFGGAAAYKLYFMLNKKK